MQMPSLSRLFKAKSAPPLSVSSDTSDYSKPNPKEEAWYSNTFFSALGPAFRAWNPDVLVGRKGADVYRQMLRDPQVKAAYNFVIGAILYRKYKFTPQDDSPEQQEIANFLIYNVEQFLSGTFIQALKTILLAKAQGYSVSEKLYEVGNFNGEPKWMLKAIRSRRWETFYFEQDNFGNVVGLIQYQAGSEKKLDPKKFIIYIAYPELDPIFGESDLRSAYRPYWEKDNIQKFWNIYIERMAGGFLLAKPNENAVSLTGQEKIDFQNMLKNVSQGTSIQAPYGWDFQMISGVATDAFEKAIAYRDAQIAKSLLVPELSGIAQQGDTGSYSQSQTQADSFMMTIEQQGLMLSDMLNEQVFGELVYWNYGDVPVPLFSFEPHTELQKREIVTSWALAVEKGIVINTYRDEQRTRSLLQYDDREEDEEALTKPKQEMAPPILPQQEVPKEPTPEEQKNNVEKLFASLPEDPTPWKTRAQFEATLNVFDAGETSFFDDLSEVIDGAYEEIKDSVKFVFDRINEDKNQVDFEGTIKKLDEAITAKTKSKMSKTIGQHLRKAYEAGRGIAQEEVTLASMKAESMSQRIRLAAFCSKRSAVRFEKDKDYLWSVMDFVEGLRLDTAEKYFAAKEFYITGKLTQEMIDAAKQVILNGIKDEKSYDQIIRDLEEVLQPFIGQLNQSGQTDKAVRSRIGTITRTNIVEAFNQAQMAVYTDPDLGDFVQALEYDSTLDSVTTPFCREYNGRIYPLNDPIWKQITPPNHFNCRSRTIPVTVLDKWQESEKARDASGDLLQPGAGFGNVE